MKNGTCVKCNSSNVYHKENELNTITLNGAKVGSKSFICTDCGYSEPYITDKEALKKIVLRAEKLGDWKKAN